jgi:hypothetical protein
MVRLFGALSALLISTTILSLVLLGIDRLLPIAVPLFGSSGFVLFCNAFIMVFGGL